MASTRVDVGQVNRHHELGEDGPAILVAPVRPPLGGHPDAVGLHKIRNVLNGRESAGDVDAIVVPSQHQVRPEVELLQRAVAGEIRAELHLEAREFHAVLLDRVEFADGEPRQCEQKRARKVGPQRIAVEIGPLQRIPRCG